MNRDTCGYYQSESEPKQKRTGPLPWDEFKAKEVEPDAFSEFIKKLMGF